MICPKCGVYIVESNPKCRNCGFEIENTIEKKKEGSNSPEKQISINHANSKKTNLRFFQKAWFMWVMLLTFYPLGLAVMWIYKKYNIVFRVIVTCIFILGIYLQSSGYFDRMMVNYNDKVLSKVSQSYEQLKPTRDAQKTNYEENKERIEFKNISISNFFDNAIVIGEATNGDKIAHSFDIKVGFYDENSKLISTATGNIYDLRPGSTKVFEAISNTFPKNIKYQKAQVNKIIN